MITRRCQRGFSLLELLFAIAIMGFGIMGILSVFVTGLSAASWSQNSTTGAVEAQTLAAKIASDVDAGGNFIYLNRIEAPNSVAFPNNQWIHTAGNTPDPVLVDPDALFPGDATKAKTDLWWQCRVSVFPMDKKDPLDSTKDDKTLGAYPRGLYQIAVAVYRNVKPGKTKKPMATYTTLVTVQN